MESPAFANERILVHVNYDENDYGYTYYYNGQKFDNGTANPYYTPNCTDSTCRPAGCTDLWDCTLDTTNNQVYSVLLGSAIPQEYVSMADGTYYDHYSIPTTVEYNWGLSTLGKKDKMASVSSLNAGRNDTSNMNHSNLCGLQKGKPFFVSQQKKKRFRKEMVCDGS
ncbi:hypothetical protein ACA910_001458 [Epithemia clementina (nom. ined.)]